MSVKKIIYIVSVIFFVSAATYIVLLKNYSVTVVGYLNQADGIGRQSIDLITLLKSNDIDVNFVEDKQSEMRDVPLTVKLTKYLPNHKLGKVVIFETWLPRFDDEEKALLKIINKKTNLTKYNRLKRDDQIFVAYSMFESTKILDRWVKLLNKNFDAVAVPSRYLIDVYKNSGVKIPIFYLPLGMNLNYYLSQPLKSKRGLIFTFANFSSMQPRKNQISLVKAFTELYKNNPDVKLIINARYGDENVYHEIKQYIDSNKVKNISIAINTLNDKEYNQLLSSVDCFVYVAKGEGFSIQPREAMALGIPVILSNNTAQRDIAKSNLVKAVPSEKEEPAIYSFYADPIGTYFNIELADLKEAMEDVYKNYDKYLLQSNQAREWVKSYDYTNLAELYLNLIKPKKVIYGKENKITEQYLETNDFNLYSKYVK
jgi:glycosyltransferase involved in cell wall biosynthesis